MSVFQELITTHFLLRGTKGFKPAMPKSRENKILMLITQQRCNSLCNHELFKYSIVSALGDIIGNFTTFEGWPLDALNAHCFVREPWISVCNATNCCKMIFLNNDI